ncbi:MAG: hypothetical protein PHX08_25420, partial [Lachnospiraceae bacterium]|nr:hypothetical protein [Lachnospiraceae bacterium]
RILAEIPVYKLGFEDILIPVRLGGHAIVLYTDIIKIMGNSLKGGIQLLKSSQISKLCTLLACFNMLGKDNYA